MNHRIACMQCIGGGARWQRMRVMQCNRWQQDGVEQCFVSNEWRKGSFSIVSSSRGGGGR